MRTISISAKLIKPAVIATFIGMFSTSANATVQYYDVMSDAGSYSPIALGDNLTLDACGSQVNIANDPGGYPSWSICSIPNYSIFSLTWEITYNGVTSQLATFSGASVASGISYTTATGAGTLLSQAGSYVIGLLVSFNSNSSFTLPTPYYGHSYGYTGNDTGNRYSTNGYYNTGYDTANLTINAAPVSVPEPAAALLLLPGLAMVMHRQRRRKQAEKLV